MRRFASILIIGSFLAVPAALAQTDLSFTISPAKREFVVEAGQSVSYVVSVTNNLGAAREFTVTPQSLPGQGPYSLLPYLDLSTSRLTVGNGETASFTVNAAIPAEAPPGGLLAGIQVATVPPKDGAAKLSAALQSLIFIRVEGEVKESGELKKFGILGGPFQLLKDEIKFYFSYQNDGNVYLNPYGGIDLERVIAWGKEGSLAVSPNFVLPKDTKTREVKFLPQRSCGLYRATLNLNRGYGDVVDRESAWLFFCPMLKFKLW